MTIRRHVLPWLMRHHTDWKAYLALVSVCFFWGTTYLAIRMALESFPPMLLISARFLISGSIMLAFLAIRGTHLPRGMELLRACFSGALVLGAGNGCLVFAERLIPSGLAGLIITISPFWMVGLEAVLPGGVRLHGPTLIGMFVGLGGAALLVAPDIQSLNLHGPILQGFLILSVGMASWSYGSIYQKRQTVRAHPVVIGAVHQLTAGLVFLPLTLAFPGDPVRWSAKGVGAILYLVFFGSIVGYSSYAYALDKLPVAVVSVFPYVNAVVAVALGWIFYREPFGQREAVAMMVIFAGVGIVKWQQKALGVVT